MHMYMHIHILREREKANAEKCCQVVNLDGGYLDGLHRIIATFLVA